MTEYNLFCYSEDYGDENSFQQKNYRAFNKEVGKCRYYEIRHLVFKIIPNPKKLQLTDFWQSITQDQWQQLLAIPEANDFKEGFEFISDCKIENRKEKESEIEHLKKEVADIKKENDLLKQTFREIKTHETACNALKFALNEINERNI